MKLKGNKQTLKNIEIEKMDKLIIIFVTHFGKRTEKKPKRLRILD